MIEPQKYKFRAWDDNAMYTQDFAAFHFGRNADKVPGMYWACYMYHEFGGDFCCDSTDTDAILMQFTGLCDMHGKEIYEGDIIRGGTYNGSYAYGIVEYMHDKYVLIPIGKFVEGVCDIFYNLHFLDIIGNIYQNPELLEQQ